MEAGEVDLWSGHQGCQPCDEIQRLKDDVRGPDQFSTSVAELKGLKQGRLRIAVVTTAKYFLPRLLGPFCQRYPGIEVSLKVTNRERLLSRLETNEDDIYIMAQPPRDRDVAVEPFMENPLVVLASRYHPLAGVARIPIQRLADEHFLMRESGSGTRKALERLFAEHGVTPKVRMELGSNEAIKQGIVGGLGISVLSQHTLALDAAAGQIIILDVEHFPIQHHWYVVRSAEKEPSMIVRTFLDYLYEAAAALVDVPCHFAEHAGACPLQPVQAPVAGIKTGAGVKP